jgi:hypothetical protein
VASVRPRDEDGHMSDVRPADRPRVRVAVEWDACYIGMVAG